MAEGGSDEFSGRLGLFSQLLVQQLVREIFGVFQEWLVQMVEVLSLFLG